MRRLILGVLAALAFAWPAVAAVGTPVAAGSASVADGGGTILPVSIAVDIPAGALIIVAAKSGDGTGSPGLSGVTIGGETFSLGTSAALGSQRLRFAFLSTAVGYSSGTNVTLTFTSAASARQAIVAYVTGIAPPTASALDIQGAGVIGTSTAPTVTTTDFGVTEGIVFSALYINSASTTVTGEPWSQVASIRTPDDRLLSLVYATHSNTAALTYAPTISSSQQWRLNYIAFKAAGSSGSAPVSRRMLTGVGK